MASCKLKNNKRCSASRLWINIEKAWRKKNLEGGGADEVLEMIAKIPFNERTPRMLTMQGMCILLSEKLEYELSDVEKCYRQAIKIDPMYVDAMIELAYFLDVNMLEPRKALYWFGRAKRVTLYLLKQIENGIKNVEFYE